MRRGGHFLAQHAGTSLHGGAGGENVIDEQHVAAPLPEAPRSRPAGFGMGNTPDRRPHPSCRSTRLPARANVAATGARTARMPTEEVLLRTRILEQQREERHPELACA